ncbi:MAG TPA: LptE family protein [Candidatus Acidoferrales bacterium]|nr:LptE family protein [Candidatus Acidoferrales bacterium]
MKYCAVLVFLIVLGGCAYSFRGASLPPGVHSVAVQVFDDNSGFGDPNLRTNLTNQLTQKLITDNTLRVTNMSNADAAIIGAVTSVNTQPSAVSGNQQVSEWRITVNVSIKFENLKTQKNIWTKDFSNYGDYDPSAGPSNRDLGLNEAENKLTDDILLAVVTNW